MIEVSTFADFLEAIAGTEDVVLTADLDAKAEGYNTLLNSNLSIQCNVDGQGHSISNIHLESDGSGNSSIYVAKTVENVSFLNFYAKNTDSVYFFYGSGILNKVIASAYLKPDNNSSFRIASSSLLVTDSTFDITFASGTYHCAGFLMKAKSARNNFVFRNGNFRSNVSSWITLGQGGLSSAFVFKGCNFDGTYAISSSNSGHSRTYSSHFAFIDCTGNATITAEANHGNVVAYTGDISVTSDVPVISMAQLSDKAYLTEIGFLP